jgi:hypothetical protein
MISIDEVADFTLRCHNTLESAMRRIKELEEHNKRLQAELAHQAPKE